MSEPVLPSAENDVPRGFVDGDSLLDEILADTAENDAPCTCGECVHRICCWCGKPNPYRVVPPGLTDGEAAE